MTRPRAARARDVAPRLAAGLVAAALAAALLSACDGKDAASPPPPRLLIVGWDGATFEMIDRLVAAGRLPCVADLLERGTSAALESTRVPISSAAWTSIVTGNWPGQTGVYGFFEPVPGTYDVRLVDARSDQATPIWRILTRRGLGVNVFGVPVTYPPEPVNGHFVAGMLSPFDATYAYPPAYTDELRGRGFVPDLGVWRQEEPTSMERIRTQLQLKETALIELLARDDWALSLVVFKSLDVACHRAYTGLPDGTIGTVYEWLDAVLARMIEAAGPGTNVLLVSDHGFRAYPTGLNLNEWMVQAGYSVRRAEASSERGSSSGPLAQQRATRYRDRIAELDMTRTRAFATVAEGNYGAIRLNVAGREPNGIVPPDSVDALLDELSERLTASPGFTATFRGRDLYPGPEQRVVPDLVVESDTSFHVFVRPARRVRAPHHRPFPDHDLYGILVAAGPSIAANPGRGTASVVDIAPTALHLLDCPVYERMEGHVLTGLLRQAYARLAPRVHESDDPAAGPGATEAGDFSESERAELEQRLRSLGYAD